MAGNGPRSVRAEELGDMLRLVNLVFRGSENPSVSMEDEFPLLFKRNNLDHLYIIKEGRKIVSHVGFVLNNLVIYGAEISVGSIGAVCTHPDHRGKGYASRLLHHCLREMKKAGADLALISGDRDLYRRAGCYPAGEIYQFAIAKKDLRSSCPRNVEIHLFQADDLGAVNQIYEQEPVRFFRGWKRFKDLLSVGRAWMGGERQVLLISDSGKLLAYMVLLRKGHTGWSEGIIWELAGARDAIVASFPQIFARYELDILTLYVNPYDYDLAGLLQEQDINQKKGSLPDHTVGVLNFAELIRKLRPYFKKVCETKAEIEALEREGKYVFRALGEEYAVQSREELVRLLFGPRWKEGSLALVPEGIRGFLAKIFPVPLPWPGLNYV